MPSPRRLILAAATTLTVFAVPAAANAATCSFDTSRARVDVQMTAGQAVVISRVNESLGQLHDARILVDGHICATPNGNLQAQLSFTKDVVIRSANPAGFDVVSVQEGNGRFENPVTHHRPTVIALTGTGDDSYILGGGPGPDQWIAMSGLGARVDMGGETVAPDFISTTMGKTPLTMVGGGGDDILSGGFNIPSIVAGYPLTLIGQDGNDTLLAGNSGKDTLQGGNGSDILRSDNLVAGDKLFGDAGNDVAIVDRFKDSVTGVENGNQVGKLKIGRKRVRTDAEGNAELTLSWTHPKAWQRLKTVAVKLVGNGTSAGRITLNPATGRFAGSGPVRVLGSRSTVSKQGKTVTMKVAFHVTPERGRDTLGVNVEATDRAGVRQMETGVASIRVR
jgi:Ca2+-binding RTX toxin-like protein